MQQGFRIFFPAQADDDMFDIIRPMVDQGGNPFFQPPDPEGINYMSDFYHSAYSNPVSGFGLITDPWTDNYLLFFEFFESHSSVDRLCSHINAWKENLEKSREKVCTCTNKPVILWTETIAVLTKRGITVKIVYQKQGNWFVGHIQEYPDYETQGRTIEELKANLIDIYQDISTGLVPDATTFPAWALEDTPGWLRRCAPYPRRPRTMTRSHSFWRSPTHNTSEHMKSRSSENRGIP